MQVLRRENAFELITEFRILIGKAQVIGPGLFFEEEAEVLEVEGEGGVSHDTTKNDQRFNEK